MGAIYHKQDEEQLFILEPEKDWDLKKRTRLFALDCINLVGSLPTTEPGRIIGKQLLRASTSVGANYRAASLAQSRATFIAKLSIVLEEADECCYWPELIIESNLFNSAKLVELYNEAGELTKIFAAARIKARTSSN